MKKCWRCRKEKSDDYFRFDKRKQVLRKLCIDCEVKAKQTRKLKQAEALRQQQEMKLKQNNLRKIKWYHQNKEKVSIRLRAKKYKISEEHIQELLLSNCMICNQSNNLKIDHCHQTGKVRGTLCNNCNLGIGNFHDSIFLLNQACKYLFNNNNQL